MPPALALSIWFVLLVALWRYDPAKDNESSAALWVPLLWLFFLGSRLPSQWLGVGATSAAAAYQEGSPLDRSIFLGLTILAVGILVSRSFRWTTFAGRQFALTAFVFFALLSVLWSDNAFISFKRWVRDIGGYLTMLIVLTEPSPIEAVRTLLRRVSYLLIPLSVLLIKYYPNVGKGFSQWTGEAYFLGAATTKNMLGVMCLISGLFFVWDTLVRWAERKERKVGRIVWVNIAFMAMTLWLLNLASSATSTLCLVLGCLLLAAAHTGWFTRHRTALRLTAPIFLSVYVILHFGFNINEAIAQVVGRDPTLTDRSIIWELVLGMVDNPLLGTGYESFWLPPRLDVIWSKFPSLNNAHSGYIEMYLNLGLLGVLFLVGFLLANYKDICNGIGQGSSLASLNLALWTVLLFYNITEAAFKSQLLWVTFVLATVAVSKETVFSRFGSFPAPNHLGPSRVRYPRTVPSETVLSVEKAPGVSTNGRSGFVRRVRSVD